MKTPFSFCLAVAFALLGTPHFVPAQDVPQMPGPPAEAGWLQKFVGEWESESEIHMEPGKPPMKGAGSESIRSLGGFWIVADGKGEMMGMNMGYVMNLSFDSEKKKYVGNWIDSSSNYRWSYEGSLDESGKILTLDAEGPCPMKPGQLSKFRDVTEFVDENTRKFSSMMQGDDGEWITLVTGTSKRKK